MTMVQDEELSRPDATMTNQQQHYTSSVNLSTMAMFSPSTSLPKSRRRICRYALVSRLVILVGMMVSCMCIPDLNPGDGVLRFDLRFASESTTHGVLTKNESISTTCFCLAGYSCDDDDSTFVQDEIRQDRTTPPSRTCVTTHHYQRDSSSSPKWTRIVDSFYFYLLQPLTRWDAARFLTLAINPRQRYPTTKRITDCDDYHFRRDDNEKDVTDTCLNHENKYEEDMKPQQPQQPQQSDPFVSSEEAHAFFPLFPLFIRTIANNIFLVWIPPTLLPPTYEGVIVLSALVLNLGCFIVAALALQDVTYYTLTTRGRSDTEEEVCRSIAQLTASLFCINPASIFFSVGYSESLFAMLTFSGHALTARGYIYMAIFPWLAASYARSNGTLTSIWLVLYGISQLVVSLEKITRSFTSAIRGIYHFMMYVGIAVLMAVPVWYHDQTGYSHHCDVSKLSLKPRWCHQDDDNAGEPLSRFSLYQYVQRKHWNVGFLHYYELPQIPNFLLAAPILYLTLSATTFWISRSWKNYTTTIGSFASPQKERTAAESDKNASVAPKRYVWYNPIHIIRWAIFALRAVVVTVPASMGVGVAKTNTVPKQQLNSPVDVLLCGPQMLGHYAVLAVLGFVGLTVAHVQVSTRLICSSCVAIYWYMSYLILDSCTQQKNQSNNQSTSTDNNNNKDTCQHYEYLKHPVLYYCFSYIILGIIMHVNWMPWT